MSTTTTTDAAPTMSRAAVNNGDDGRSRLDEAHRSLRTVETTGEEVISSLVTAWSEVVRAFLPAVLTEPARAVDIAFEFVQQSINIERRLVQEIVGSVQLALGDVAADRPLGGGGEADDSAGSARAGRRGATRSAA